MCCGVHGRVKSACQRLLTLEPPISLWLANMAVCTPRGPDAAAAAAAVKQQLSVCPKITRPRSHVLARPGLTNDIIIIISVQL